MDITTTILAAIAANLAGINGKIVWDWLSDRKNPQGNNSTKFVNCPFRETHDKDIEKLKQRHMISRQDLTRHEVLITERTTEIFQKLKENREDHRQLFEDISVIKSSLGSIERCLEKVRDK